MKTPFLIFSFILLFFALLGTQAARPFPAERRQTPPPTDQSLHNVLLLRNSNANDNLCKGSGAAVANIARSKPSAPPPPRPATGKGQEIVSNYKKTPSQPLPSPRPATPPKPAADSLRNVFLRINSYGIKDRYKWFVDITNGVGRSPSPSPPPPKPAPPREQIMLTDYSKHKSSPPPRPPNLANYHHIYSAELLLLESSPPRPNLASD